MITTPIEYMKVLKDLEALPATDKKERKRLIALAMAYQSDRRKQGYSYATWSRKDFQ